MTEAVVFTQSDARADGGLREVALSRATVLIRRRYRNVAMRLAIPAAHYHGIAACAVAGADAASRRVVLVHRDAEFDVVLSDAVGPSAALAAARQWAVYFGLPLVGDGPAPRVAAPHARRRSATLAKRRRRYWARRKPGFALTRPG
jgi:hypothetical protein